MNNNKNFFATVAGTAGGIYGLYYAYTHNSSVLGYVGYYLLFGITFSFAGAITDVILPIKDTQK